MNMLNSLIMEGVVTRELTDNPDCKDFEIAVSRFYKNAEGELNEEKSFFTVELYGNMAERGIIVRNIYKDRGVRVVGRLKQRRWKDEEGKEYSRVVVIAEHIAFKLHIKKAVENTEENAEENTEVTS